MTKEEAFKKAEELKTKLSVTVHPVIFVGADESDLIIGFIKEPSFLVKARAMDRSLLGQSFTASLEILESCLLVEESDPRILSETAGDGRYKLGAAEFCRNIIKISVDQAEKKS